MDEAEAVAKRKKEELDKEIEAVKKEYEEKLKRKGEKAKEKNKERDKEESKQQKKDEAEEEAQVKKEKNEKVLGQDSGRHHRHSHKLRLKLSQTSKTAPTLKRISLEYMRCTGELATLSFPCNALIQIRNFYQMRLDKLKNAEIAKRNKERLNNSSSFPSVPSGNP